MTINHVKEYDEIIRNWVEKFPRSYFKKVKAKANSHILKYIEDNTPLLSDKHYLISTRVYWILNDITEFPKCKICGKEIRKNVKATEGYPEHCSAQCLSDDPEVKRNKEESYLKRYGVVNPFQAEEVKNKITETNFMKYGVKRFTQTDEYKRNMESLREIANAKKYRTHKKNNSFHISKFESVVYDILKKKYPDVVHPYRDESRYPFDCDFYIPSEDLFVEYNGTWTHGGHWFDACNPDDARIVEKWSAGGTGYYRNAIYTWTDLDVRKRNAAEKSGLNYKVFWNIDEVYSFVYPDKGTLADTDELVIKYNRKRLEREFAYYRDAACTDFDPYFPRRNDIVKFFQQDTFFAHEKDLWRGYGKDKRQWLVDNRVKYLKKDEKSVTHMDLLTGFKKSGTYYGYSHFNPMWFRWFIEHVGARVCYDPCGGWGHRLLGAGKLELYIYNDFSPSTKMNVDRMVDFFGIKNTATNCGDAREYAPEWDFDSMFTCPPYYNLELYECGGFESHDKYNEFLDSLFDRFRSTESCKVFGLVLRDDLVGSHTDYSERFQIVKNGVNYFDGRKNSNGESLYIYWK